MRYDTEDLVDVDGLKGAMEALCERRDELVGALVEDLHTVSSAINDLAYELEDQLVEYHFDIAQESVERAIGYMNAADDDRLEEIFDLLSVDLPRLELTTNDAGPSATMPKMDPWTPPDLKAPETDQERLQSDYSDIVDERVHRCATRIRKLLDFFSEELWPYIVSRAEAEDRESIDAGLRVCAEVSTELDNVFKAWILWLNELYVDNPSNLGDVGLIIEETLEELKQDQFRK